MSACKNAPLKLTRMFLYRRRSRGVSKLVKVRQQERVSERSLEQQIVGGPVPGIALEFVEFVDVPVLVVWEEF